MSNLTRTPPRSQQLIVNDTVSHSHKRRASEQGWVADVETDQKHTLDSAVQMLITEFRKTNAKIDNLSGVLDGVKKELVVVSSDVKSLKAECAEKFQVTDAKLNSVNKRVDHLQTTVGNLENRCELTIHGIPFTNDENLSDYFKLICKQLTIREPATHIRRIRPKNETKSNEGVVVVEFSLKNDRDDFYSAYLRTRDLKLRHLGLNSDHRIYVNENLTVAARKLKVLALNLRRAGKLSSVFTKLGVIHVKKTLDDQPVAIQGEEDFEIFVNMTRSLL